MLAAVFFPDSSCLCFPLAVLTLTSHSLIDDKVNEPPVLAAHQRFSVGRGSVPGTVIGAIACSDEDSSKANPAWGQLAIALVGGNVNSTFRMDGERLVVAALSADLRLVNFTFALSVTVTDGGGLSTAGAVAVLVVDANRNPVVSGSS